MKRHLVAVAILFLAGAAGRAQDRTRVYARPVPPPEAVLDRLHLRMGWQTIVPSDGPRDGIASIQVLADMVLVQMRSGGLTALDPEDGSTKWRSQVGLPYRASQLPGYNARLILAFNGAHLYALDRRTGRLQWQFESPNYPSAPPSADDQRVFFTTTTGRLLVYGFPREVAATDQGKKTEPIAPPISTAGTSAAQSGNTAAASLGPLGYVGQGRTLTEPPAEPLLLWDYRVLSRLAKRPILHDNLVAVADTDGIYYALTKDTHNLQYSVATGSEVAAPIGQHGGIAYIAARNFNLSAVDLDGSQILWRFSADRPVLRQPAVTDEDVYLAPEKGGLFRINRADGQAIWRNMDAERFLAVNKAFVYASDPYGRLLILDRARGTLLAALNIRDFTVPVTNDRTDRLYLASNDGTVAAFHDRDYPKPFRVKNVAEKKPEAVAPVAKPVEEKPADEKPAAKPGDEKGDKKAPPAKGDEKMKEKEK